MVKTQNIMYEPKKKSLVFFRSVLNIISLFPFLTIHIMILVFGLKYGEKNLYVPL